MRAFVRVSSNLSYFLTEDQFKASAFSGVLLGSSWTDGADFECIFEKAASRASVPVSNFRIGASMEFPGVALGSTLQAELSAVLNAWMHGESELEVLHVMSLLAATASSFYRS